MGIPVARRVNKILRQLNCFIPCHSLNNLEGFQGVTSPLAAEEQLLGVYENTPRSPEQAVLVSDLGVYVREHNQWRGVKYSDMLELEIPKREKLQWSYVGLRMRTGNIENIPTHGGDNPPNDTSQFMRFFLDVMRDIYRERGGKVQ